MSGRGAGRINEAAILGDWNAMCDQCGRRFKASELKKNWKGLLLCADDWEPRHMSDFLRQPREEIGLPYARTDDKPETPAVSIQCAAPARLSVVGLGSTGCMVVGLTTGVPDSTFPTPSAGTVTKA